MKYEYIEWQNFLSYGNNINRLSFEEPKFVLIRGFNGSGKSVIRKVFTWSAYGRLEDLKVASIPNRINQTCFVKTKIKTNNKDVVIERGLGPNLFKVLINGQELDQAGKRSVQQFLENEIFDIPYILFNNTIALSVNDFKSFIKMSPGDKRQIVDRIFSLNIFNEMRSLLKGELKAISDWQLKTNKELQTIQQSLKVTEHEINQLESKLQQNATLQKDQLLTEFAKYQQYEIQINDSINQLQKHVAELDSNEKKLHKGVSVIDTELKEIQRKIELYDNQKCPLCESDLTTEYHTHLQDGYEQLKQDKLELRDRIVVKLNEIIESKKKCNSELLDLRDKFQRCKVKLQSTESQLKTLKDLSSEELQSLFRIKQNFLNQHETLNDELSIKVEDQKFLEFVEFLLSEDGIKKVIIRQIIPNFNREINKYMAKLGLSYIIQFNEELDPIILEYGHQIAPETLSTGEAKKVDFAVLIALLKTMKTKFSDVNILFLDEIFSSIDQDSMHQILSILKEFQIEMQMTIFVINHSDMPLEFFDEIINVKKIKGFSQLEVEKIS